MTGDGKPRCAWMGDDELMLRYHDEEWGVPLHDDRRWFEFMVLDAFQAGLSWRTVLHKREAFRKVFHDFDPERVVRMPQKEVDQALKNKSIIRNRLKIQATIKNARAFLQVQEERGTFDDFIWEFTDGHTIHNAWTSMQKIPASSKLSDEVSKALKARGFTFVGTTICYSLLQAAGVVNDHLVHCYRYKELTAGGR